VGSDVTEGVEEVVDLLQHLIRNACVNDGSVESGQEQRSADVLAQYLGASGFEVERYEPRPARQSLVARIEGSDPAAPTLLLMGHTDVVPVNPAGWSRDPFGAQVVDGCVWGRGAIDMLNLTASMAVAVKRLARSGFRPRGTLVYLAVADEEALGAWGAGYLVDHEWEAVAADYVITEAGGFQIPTQAGPRLPVMVAEKGTYWCRLTVSGTAGHASQPLRRDNALVTAAEVVRRLATYRPPTRIEDWWRRFATEVFPPELATSLTEPERLWQLCEELPPGIGRLAHACTHTTIAPTLIQGGSKINVIPDEVTLNLDIRTLPGQRGADVEAIIDDALGDLRGSLNLAVVDDNEPSASPAETPLWESLERVSRRLVARSALVPFLAVGATDARFFRRRGAAAYGFGLFSNRLGFEDYATMFHGNDERVDVESLALTTSLWEAVATDLLV